MTRFRNRNRCDKGQEILSQNVACKAKIVCLLFRVQKAWGKNCNGGGKNCDGWGKNCNGAVLVGGWVPNFLYNGKKRKRLSITMGRPPRQGMAVQWGRALGHMILDRGPHREQTDKDKASRSIPS